MRGDSTHSWRIPGACEFGRPREGVGTVRVPLFSREAAGLFVLGLTALAWLAEVEPLRPCGGGSCRPLRTLERVLVCGSECLAAVRARRAREGGTKVLVSNA